MPCIVAQCRRTPPRGQRICGACFSLVDNTTKLALHLHREEYLDRHEGLTHAERACYREFIIWSHEVTVSLAAVQVFETRQERAMEALRARHPSPEEQDP